MRAADLAATVVFSALILGCGESRQAPAPNGGEAESTSAPRGGPARWTVGEAPLLSVGEADGDPSYLFSRISAVRLLSGGRIAVADGGSSTLRILGPDGHPELDFGGAGEGPGEFERLGTVLAPGGDTLLAYDLVAHRLSTYLASGELVSTTRIQADNGYPEVYLGRDATGNHYFAWIQQGPRDPTGLTPDLMEVGRFDPDGAMTASLGVFPGMRRLSSPLPFSPHFVGALVDDVAFVGDGLRPVVTSLTPGGPREVSLGGEWPGADPADAWARLEAEVTHPALEDRLRSVRDAPGADSIPAYAEILPDPAGLLWVKRFDPVTDSHFLPRELTGGVWAVMDTAGRPVATVTLPPGFRLLEIRDDRVAGVSKDELGVERVAVYRLTRADAPPAADVALAKRRSP